MTVNRVCNEIDAIGLGRYYDARRNNPNQREFRLLLKGDKEEIWNRALSYFRGPIKKTVYAILQNKVGIKAGLTALSKFSMIAEPENEVIALAASNWKKLTENKEVVEINVPDSNATEVELWSYDPELFSNDGCVDPLSLYLSLKETNDERVEMALDEMMENYQW